MNESTAHHTAIAFEAHGSPHLAASGAGALLRLLEAAAARRSGVVDLHNSTVTHLANQAFRPTKTGNPPTPGTDCRPAAQKGSADHPHVMPLRPERPTSHHCDDDGFAEEQHAA